MTNIIVKVKHDNGTQNFKVWANSLEAAKQQVLKAENCPPSAIVSAQAVKPTISDIKRLTSETSPYFFSRKTLKFFNQKMSDFKVYRNGEKFLIQAKRIGGNTQRLFNPFTNELEFI